MRQSFNAYRRTFGFARRPKSFPISILFPAAICCLFVFSSCEKKGSSVVDPQGFAPFLVSASVTPNQINLDSLAQSDNLKLTIEARIVNTVSPSGIAVVNCSVGDASGADVLATGSLADDGAPPDVRAGDSVFTGQMLVPAANLNVGNYYCQIGAQSPEGLSSNTFLLPVKVYRVVNHPPVLSDLQAPDTISFGGADSVTFKLSVKATDPDGQSDIASVFFNSYKPDGSPAGGNPFSMYDDGSQNILFPPEGTSGDAVKGDSIYTLTVLINSSNAKGAYRFEFQAKDRSNAYSQKLVKYIQVVR